MKNKRRILFFSLFFVSGFTVMVFELLGSRILAPYVGNSLLTWTSIIGVILAALSIGYYVGGKLSHKNYLWQIFLCTALSYLYLVFFKDALLSSIQSFVEISHMMKIMLSSVVLFVPSSFCMALATPFMATRMIETAPDIGENMGSLYALSTFGSIVGTFMTGFVLIPLFGVNTLLFGLALVYGVLMVFFIKNKVIGVGFLVLFLTVMLLAPLSYVEENILFSQETAYGLLEVKDVEFEGQKVRRLYIDNLVQSQVGLPLSENTDLTLKYSEYYRMADFLNPGLQKTLMIGGGSYSYPQYLLENNAEVTIDVVEINPNITKIAKEYFGLQGSDRINIYHQDGRVFLNETDQKYDAIYIDAFNGFSVPTHLTTMEFVKSLYDHLTDYGVVVVNIPGFIDGAEATFIRGEYKTYKEHFEHIDLYPVTYNKNQFQNIMLVAQKKKSSKPVLWNHEYADLINHRWKDGIDIDDVPVFTDDYAPVNFYTRGYSRFY